MLDDGDLTQLRRGRGGDPARFGWPTLTSLEAAARLGGRPKGIQRSLDFCRHWQITLGERIRAGKVIRGVRRRKIPGGHRQIFSIRLPLPTATWNSLALDVGRFANASNRPTGRPPASIATAPVGPCVGGFPWRKGTTCSPDPPVNRLSESL